MPIPANVVRIVLSGDLPNGEIWSTGFFLQGDNMSTPGQLTSLATKVANSLGTGPDGEAMATTLVKLCNNQTNWRKTSAYYYAGGSTKSSAVGEYVWPTPKVGGTNVGLPEQCAAVVSLRTDHPGRSYRGRMYLPCTGANLQVNGQLVQQDVDAVAGAWGENLSRLGDPDLDPIPIIVSTHLGLSTPVTSVKMDSRVDTMRSRAKSAIIGYTKSVVLN